MSVPLAPATAHAVALANHEAKRLGSARLEPAHVLLGLCALDPSLAPALRSRGTVDRGALRLQVEWLTRDVPRGLRRDVLPPSAAARRLMIDAASEARRWGHQEVAVEHVLAALLRDDSDDAVAVQALRRCGVDVEACRAILDAALGAWFEPPAPVAAIPTGQLEGVLPYASPHAEPAARVRPTWWELGAAAATFAGIVAAAAIATWRIARL